ncbi:MAG: hypothetical protein QM669_14300 [Siphonobacter sp.]
MINRCLEAQKPNVIYTYADNLGYGNLSGYEAAKIQTLNIDLLVKEGLKLTNSHREPALLPGML